MGIGEIIANRRIALGLSQRELASALNTAAGQDTLTRHEVSRWERDEVTPRYWLRHLAAILELPIAELRLAARSVGARPTDPLRIAHEWLLAEPPQVVTRRAGRRVGAALVAELRGRAAELRRLDDQVAGAETHLLVARELSSVLDLIDSAAYTERTGRDLLGVAADLAQLAGWVNSDAGRHRRATSHYLDGVRLATLAADRSSAANNLSSLAYQTANVGPPADAVLLARSAVAGAAEPSRRVRALLTERVAWAHARAGEPDAVERALDQVDELLAADDESQPSPDWVYWLDRGEADIMAGRCYTELRRPLRAVPLLEQATTDYRAGAPRELVLYLSWLVMAYIDAHELAEACRVGQRMAELSAGTRSARAQARVQHVVARLREYGNQPEVRDLLAAVPSNRRAW